MNEQMNEQTNKWMNERTNEWTNKQKNKWTNKGIFAILELLSQLKTDIFK